MIQPKIQTQKIRQLFLTHPTSPDRLPHLSAASGLVVHHDKLYVVADDELHLGVFSARHDTPGQRLRLFEGELPDKYKKRKAAKPDLETLVQLPAFEKYPHGALLALGSGSRPTREMGVLLALNAVGEVSAAPVPVDLSAFYDDLRFEIEHLNIEGMVIADNRMRLLQRGNKGSANAVIDCNPAAFLAALTANKPPRLVSAPRLIAATLGEINGVPLCFSDGAALPECEILFTAVAENTDNSVDDGACAGSAIGSINARGEVTRIVQLADPHKVEGIAVTSLDDGIHVLLVTDADDATQPAWLLSAHWG